MQAECGYRPLLMLLGVFHGFEIECQVFSYEAPLASVTWWPGSWAKDPGQKGGPSCFSKRGEESGDGAESAPVKLAAGAWSIT